VTADKPVPALRIALLITTEQILLSDYTTLRLGGPAARFVCAAADDELIDAVATADAAAEPVLVLGGGSNLVVADQGFPGTVVLAAADGLTFSRTADSVEATVSAGHDWDEFVRRCLAEGLSGVEGLSGIPGRAGATPIQNVNAYGQDVAHTIASVRVYDRLTGQIAQLAGPDCGFGYRTSVFKRAADRPGRGQGGSPESATGRFIVLAVTFRLASSPLSAPIRYGELSRVLEVAEGGRVPLMAAREAVLELRRGKGMVLDAADPDTRSAGSFFTNPIVSAARYARLADQVAAGVTGGAGSGIPHWPADDGQVKLSAAWLIERAGFGKGYQLRDDPDGARISTKHALALTNPGSATTSSLIRLARQIRAGVAARFGVELAPEPVLVGVSL